MRCLVQRVSQAAVRVDDAVVGEIGHGMMVLACAMQGDSADNAAAMARKLSALRIFKDEAGRMNRSLVDVGGSALIISQFTLAADTSRGNRPGFSAAADPELGNTLYEALCDEVAALGIPVQKGIFGADMQVSLVNDGPVTLWVEK